MRVTVHHKGARRSYTIAADRGLVLGGDPGTGDIDQDRHGAWGGTFYATIDGGVTFALQRGSWPGTTLNGEPIIGHSIMPIHVGDVLVAGPLTITAGYTAPSIARGEPLATRERDVLTRIAAEPDADDARRVIADFWLEHGDAARGELIHATYEGLLDSVDQLQRAHGERWLALLVDAGFDRADLAFDRGFVRSLVMMHDEELADSPDAFRLAPVHYHPLRLAARGGRTHVHEAERVTPSGTSGTFAVKTALATDRDAAAVVERELKILRRFDSPHLPRVVDVAVSREGVALVTAWAGTRLTEILTTARVAQRPPGEAVAIAIGIQLCRAYAAVHAARVVHAELHSDHVLIADGHVTAVDFAFSSCDIKRVEPAMPRGRARRRFHYMSPEQVRGLPLDASTDVFALAMLLVELVTGQHPIADGLTDFDVLERVRTANVAVPETKSRLAAKLRELLVREPEPRSSAAVLGLELARIAEAAHLRVGPDVIADYMRGLGL